MITIKINWFNLDKEIIISNSELIKAINQMPLEDKVYFYNNILTENKNDAKISLSKAIRDLRKHELEQDEKLILKDFLTQFIKELEK